MAKKKKKAKLGTAGIVLLLLALAGAVIAVVGLFVSWFAASASSTLLGASSVTYFGLFDETLGKAETDFPLLLVQIFAVIAAVVAVIAALVMLLKALGVVKVSGMAKFIVALAAVALSVLAMVFAFIYAGNYGEGVNMGDLVQAGFGVAFGMFFTSIGGIVSGAALLLKK